MVSQRLRRFSQDPYVRAHYFLNHYGPVQAVYHAMGRGRLLTERVLDVGGNSIFPSCPTPCLTFLTITS